jgi:hypothetical protein
VPDYQRLSIEIVRHIVGERLDDLLDFARLLVLLRGLTLSNLETWLPTEQARAGVVAK